MTIFGHGWIRRNRLLSRQSPILQSGCFRTVRESFFTLFFCLLLRGQAVACFFSLWEWGKMGLIQVLYSLLDTDRLENAKERKKDTGGARSGKGTRGEKNKGLQKKFKIRENLPIKGYKTWHLCSKYAPHFFLPKAHTPPRREFFKRKIALHDPKFPANIQKYYHAYLTRPSA